MLVGASLFVLLLLFCTAAGLARGTFLPTTTEQATTVQLDEVRTSSTL